MRFADHTTATARHQRLLSRIHRRYVTTTQRVRIGPVNLAFTRIADPDRVLDQVAEEADRREKISGHREPDEHLHLPYWAELWDSAAGIAQFLVAGEGREERDGETGRRGDAEKEGDTGTGGCGDAGIAGCPDGAFSESFSASRRHPISPSLSSSLSVLDLGCGMGLSGTIAAALGASVLFADIEPPALLFAQLNSLPWTKRVRTRRLNWQRDRLPERFDRILGADILYERAQWDYLDPFWHHHLAPGGTILLGEPGRQTGDMFIDWIAQRGWNLQIFEEKVETRERPVRIFRLRRE